jgi:hypothetical protein
MNKERVRNRIEEIGTVREIRPFAAEDALL